MMLIVILLLSCLLLAGTPLLAGGAAPPVTIFRSRGDETLTVRFTGSTPSIVFHMHWRHGPRPFSRPFSARPANAHGAPASDPFRMHPCRPQRPPIHSSTNPSIHLSRPVLVAPVQTGGCSANHFDLSGLSEKPGQLFVNSSLFLFPFSFPTPHIYNANLHLSEVSEVSEVSGNPRLMGGHLPHVQFCIFNS